MILFEASHSRSTLSFDNLGKKYHLTRLYFFCYNHLTFWFCRTSSELDLHRKWVLFSCFRVNFYTPVREHHFPGSLSENIKWSNGLVSVNARLSSSGFSLKNVKWHSFYIFCNHVIAKALIVNARLIVAFGKLSHGNHEYHDQKMILTPAYCEYHKKCRQLTTLVGILPFTVRLSATVTTQTQKGGVNMLKWDKIGPEPCV